MSRDREKSGCERLVGDWSKSRILGGLLIFFSSRELDIFERCDVWA